MAKSGRRGVTGERLDQGDTRRRLVEGAIEALREDGFGGASARAIAGRAGCNQALVFYHFGSVVNLLLAALDETSRRRMERYCGALADVSDLSDLAAVATEIYREDMDGGHIAVLSEMIAGASSTAGLGAEVAARVAPWIDFTESTLKRVLPPTPIDQLLPTRDLAYGLVALYLGIEMLSHLDDERDEAESLLSTASRVAGLLGALGARQPQAEGG